jgi:hypothetical protein
MPRRSWGWSLLDVLTPKGQESVQQEAHAVSLLTATHPQYEYIHTPKWMPADVDAMLLKRGELHSIVETKCRTCTLDTFHGAFNSEWLVTFDKIVKARDIAMRLGVGLTGFLYLTKSGTLLVQPITDRTGLFIPKVRIETTDTQATVNGGTARRSNAFIDMTKAKVFQ